MEADGDAIVTVLKETVTLEQHEDAFAVLGQMDDAHPGFPHWYLAWFGVDGAAQGRGLGGTLMEHCLRIVDEDHMPAYLDSPNPRNISFYERHGFEVTGEAQAGACPPVVSMLRVARSPAHGTVPSCMATGYGFACCNSLLEWEGRSDVR